MNTYVVTLTLNESLSEDRADVLLDELGRYGAVVSLNGESSLLTLTVDADDLGAAATRGLTLVQPHAEAVAVHVEREKARDLREFGEAS